jgi:hypothetical protein
MYNFIDLNTLLLYIFMDRQDNILHINGVILFLFFVPTSKKLRIISLYSLIIYYCYFGYRHRVGECTFTMKIVI